MDSTVLYLGLGDIEQNIIRDKMDPKNDSGISGMSILP